VRQRIEIDGDTLTLDAIERVAFDREVEVALAPGAEERILRSRAVVDAALREERVVYGVTTGFGRLAETVIPIDRVEELQLNLIRSHACGVGPALPRAETRPSPCCAPTSSPRASPACGRRWCTR
jgi:histidine ammonia-lyase